MANADVTEDALLNGRIRIRQPARGYRVNVDTLLLAAALPATGIGNGPVVEVGCGVGAALLAVAKDCIAHNRPYRFVGIERDPVYARLARENAELNGLTREVEILEMDALDPHADIGQFYSVFFNPPYDTPGEGRRPAEDRVSAYLADRPISDWIKVWSNRMTAHACLTLIHRAHRLGEILEALDGKLGGVEVLPIRPCGDKPARRVIVRARKGSRAPMHIFKGLDLHPSETSKDKYTPEAEALLRGEAALGWFGSA